MLSQFNALAMVMTAGGDSLIIEVVWLANVGIEKRNKCQRKIIQIHTTKQSGGEKKKLEGWDSVEKKKRTFLRTYLNGWKYDYYCCFDFSFDVHFDARPKNE